MGKSDKEVGLTKFTGDELFGGKIIDMSVKYMLRGAVVETNPSDKKPESK